MNHDQQVQIVANIRTTLEGYIGKRLRVRANMGRQKFEESEGKLLEVHPSLFLMEVERKRGRTSRQSFQYADVLVGTVELFCDEEPIFGTFIKEDEEEQDTPAAELIGLLEDDLLE